ncbi:hypothetical protein KUCAC02_021705 [Chaenocephalus aceratus]|uniref:Uncharacterized protein n=1 Tax=Chaenocephalus aceratus TaxID=36190 RepID=A0ACB9XGB3_CHAAC|nr:hypothetical protein KUCAC02_021705 [Chaenocephalus aceratus]
MALTPPVKEHPYSHLIDTLQDGKIQFFNLQKLSDPRYDKLPLSIRVLLEAAVRNCDGFFTKEEDVQNVLDWQQQQSKAEVPFSPARVLLQDFTGIPAMVDLAAMRDAVAKHGMDPSLVNPKCPTDLIVDHSLQIDYSKCHSAIQNAPNPGAGVGQSQGPGPSRPALSWRGSQCGVQRGSCSKSSCSDPPPAAGRGSGQQIENTPLLCPFHLKPVSDTETTLKNQEMELIRNKERLQFFKWCSKAFKNVNVVPPDVGAVHQVNLEYLCRVVQVSDGFIYPDSVVGTDSHTTMINGLGILGWAGVLTLPEVVGCKLVGSINPLDHLHRRRARHPLSITKHLRQAGISGKFVEFFGAGVCQLSAPDRTTIANMCPEYNATVSFFPIDQVTLKHFRNTNFTQEKLELIESYLKAVKLFRSYEDASEDPEYLRKRVAHKPVIEINLSTIAPCVSGPKRSQDRVAVSSMKEDFQSCLDEKVGFKGFHVSKEKQNALVPFLHGGQEYQLAHGSLVIAAVISCTNNCNPSVMLTAGLLPKGCGGGACCEALHPDQSSSWQWDGPLTTSVPAEFEVIGYGCATCVGNTAPLPEAVVDAINRGTWWPAGSSLVTGTLRAACVTACGANYLASPPLVVAYALAGKVGIDFEKEPLGETSEGKQVFLRDIWPSREEVQQTEEDTVISSVFKDLRARMEKGNTLWSSIECPDSVVFPWDHKSTYIRSPSFFSKLVIHRDAHVLLFLGNKVTTDHISPAGSIARVSAAAKYLQSKRLTPREFNSYGARRGNDAVMTRGTFASIKLLNRFIGKTGPKTLHIPTGQTLDVFEAADRYHRDGVPLIILAGKDYGSGNSRDWVAKGPYLLGVRAVIAESFEKLHVKQLVGVGIVPLQFLPDDSADSLELSGKERFSVTLPESLSPRQQLTVKTSQGKSFLVTALFDTEMDVIFFQHGGHLRYVARTFL